MIYLDYSATTPVDEDVLNTYVKIQKDFFANTTSLHKLGQISNHMFEKATKETLDILDLKEHNIVYTSNATEANNLAIFGILNKFSKGKIITTKIEHPSVFEVFKSFENENFDVVYLDVDEKGIISLDQLKKEIDNNTILISIMWVNNIVGSIQPIKEIIEIIKNYPKVFFHVDIVQGICKIKMDFDLNKIDMFTFSTHKIYGPKGIGVLGYRKNIDFFKRLYGSSSQYGIKPGTIDLALIVCTTKTLKIYYPKTEDHYQNVKKMNHYLRSKIKPLKNIIINSSEEGSPYILNVSILNNNGETIVHILEEDEIYVSTGSACSSKLKKPEKTVYAMTNSVPLATSTIRISLSHLTTYQDIDKLINALEKINNV